MNYGEQAQSQKVALADQRQKVRRYLTNTNALESVLADIAEGTKVSEVAARLNVSYHAMYTVLNSTYKEQYRSARAAFADRLAEKNLDVADKIESQEIPHDAGKAAVGIRQWVMERSAGEQWGQRSSVDVTHKGVVGLHLDAIRQLTDEPIDGEYVEVEHEEAKRVGAGGGGSVDGGTGVDDADDLGDGEVSAELKEPPDEGDDGAGVTADDLENHPLL